MAAKKSNSLLWFVVLLLLAWAVVSGLMFRDCLSNSSYFHGDNVLKKNLSEPGFSEQDGAVTQHKYIEIATGLSLAWLDVNGNPLKGTSYAPGTKAVISYRGKAILEDEKSAHVNFESLYFLPDEQAVLLSQDPGGNACNTNYYLISVRDGAATLNPKIGNCAAPDVMQTADGKLKFVFDAGYGRRIVGVYEDHRYTEKLVNLPLNNVPSSSVDGFRYLEKYAAADDLENMLQDSKLNASLSQIMCGDFHAMKQRMDLYNISITDKLIVVTGQMAHSFSSDESIMVISLDSNVIYAAVLKSNYNITPSSHIIDAYTNQSANSPVNEQLQQWIDHFAASNKQDIRWHYQEECKAH